MVVFVSLFHFPSPHVHPSSVTVVALTMSQQGMVWLQVWVQVHRHQWGFWRSWVLLLKCAFSKGRSVAPLWPMLLFGLLMRWCTFLTHPKTTHFYCTELLVQISCVK